MSQHFSNARYETSGVSIIWSTLDIQPTIHMYFPPSQLVYKTIPGESTSAADLPDTTLLINAFAIAATPCDVCGLQR